MFPYRAADRGHRSDGCFVKLPFILPSAKNSTLPSDQRSALEKAQVYNHGIPQELIDACFEASRGYFALPDEVKARTPFQGFQGGWEKEQQARERPAPSAAQHALATAHATGASGAQGDQCPVAISARQTCTQAQTLSGGLFAAGAAVDRDRGPEGVVPDRLRGRLPGPEQPPRKPTSATLTPALVLLSALL